MLCLLHINRGAHYMNTNTRSCPPSFWELSLSLKSWVRGLSNVIWQPYIARYRHGIYHWKALGPYFLMIVPRNRVPMISGNGRHWYKENRKTIVANQSGTSNSRVNSPMSHLQRRSPCVCGMRQYIRLPERAIMDLNRNLPNCCGKTSLKGSLSWINGMLSAIWPGDPVFKGRGWTSCISIYYCSL